MLAGERSGDLFAYIHLFCVSLRARAFPYAQRRARAVGESYTESRKRSSCPEPSAVAQLQAGEAEVPRGGSGWPLPVC